MIDERTPHNAKAVELFTTHLPEWFAPIVIEAHLKSCELDKAFMSYNPDELKQAFALSVNWDILNLCELGHQTEGNEIQVGSEALADFFEQFVSSPKPPASKEVTTSNEKFASSELKLSPEAIAYLNRLATNEGALTATLESKSWWTLQNIASILNIVVLSWLIIFRIIIPLFQ